MANIGISPVATYDSIGNGISSVNVPGQGNALSVEQSATGFVFSTNNSSSAQLAVGATFTGVIETALSQSAISLLLTSDQPITLTINQFIDLAGTQAVTPITFNILAGAQFSRSIVLNGNYVQVIAKNVGTAITTTFNLNTAYGTIQGVDGQGATTTQGYLTGKTGSDFDSVPLLDSVVSGDLPLHVKTINNPTQDVNGSLILSDMPQTVKIVASTVGQVFTIDTLGYQTIIFSTQAFVGTLLQSQDGITWGGMFGINTNNSGVSNLSATLGFFYPCQARYVRVTCTTVGSFSYSLKNSPLFMGNINTIGGALVSATTAQLGMNIVNIGGTANASQAGTITLGTTAATNGMTLGTLVAPLTVAATVVKASAGKLYALNVGNAQASAVYLKLYNATSVTLGTTSPIQNIMIPASSTVAIPINDVGLYFSTGICFAVTGGQALLDSTALTTASVVNYSYI